MPYTSRNIILHGGVDRLHLPLFYLYGILAAFHTAVCLRLGQRTNWAVGDYMTALCALSPHMVRLPLFGPIECLLENTISDQVQLVIEPAEVLKARPDSIGERVMDANPYVINMVSPVFVSYFESYRPWLAQHIGKIDRWPATVKFAGVVRNAASHGGKVRMTGKKPRPVHWHGLTYSINDNGRQTIGGDLSLGDIIVLMAEMSDELDALHCPRLT